MFLVNLANHILSLDTNSDSAGESGVKLSPYYEQLDDEIVLDMALPASDKAWDARSEEEWREAVAREELERCYKNLREVLAGNSKEALLAQYGRSASLSSSDGLRALIIRCALVQFST